MIHCRLNALASIIAAFSIQLMAQTSRVDYFKQAECTDLSARTNGRFIVKEGLSLIRLSIDSENVTVSGLIEHDVIIIGSEYYIYMRPGATSLRIKVPGYEDLFLSDSYYPQIFPLKPNAVYSLKVNLPRIFSKESDTENYIKAKATTDYKERIVHLLKIKDRTPDVLFMMAQCYVGIPGSYSPLKEQIQELAIAAAEGGNKDACSYLGTSYYWNDNYDEAFKWYEKGANLGDIGSMRRLASLYIDKTGEGNDLKAFNLYLRTAEATPSTRDEEWEVADARCMVGQVYMFGMSGIDQDYNKAFYWFDKSARDNNKYARSLFWLGQCYEFGHGTASNQSKAAEYYRSAINEDDDEWALAQLGFWYLYGKNCDQDINLAFDYLTRAAKQRECRSLNFLGQVYIDGLYGRTKDEEKGYDYLYTGFFATCGSSVWNPNYCGEIFYHLGRCREYGLGTKIDIESARRMYESAAEDGIEGAKEALLRLSKK